VRVAGPRHVGLAPFYCSNIIIILKAKKSKHKIKI
jgi:hypothetical protein